MLPLYLNHELTTLKQSHTSTNRKALKDRFQHWINYWSLCNRTTELEFSTHNKTGFQQPYSTVLIQVFRIILQVLALAREKAIQTLAGEKAGYSQKGEKESIPNNDWGHSSSDMAKLVSSVFVQEIPLPAQPECLLGMLHLCSNTLWR